jgi:tetratricopeptide (TPR) repeat protein
MSQNLAWAFKNRPMDPFRQLSLASARRAVELDPNDSGAHRVLAHMLLFEHRWDESAKEYDISLRLNPSDAEAWLTFGELKFYEGRGVEAIACVEKAFRLNPRPPGYFFWTLGVAQFVAGRYEAAVKTLSRDPTYRTQCRRVSAAALAQLGRVEEAQEAARLYLADDPDFRISHWLETMPYRDAATRDRFVEGYRKAGLPE